MLRENRRIRESAGSIRLVINLVVALASEARPLVRHFGLSQDRVSRGFRVYTSGHIRLVVTGVGKLNAAAGVSFIAGQDGTPDQVWLNVGLGGHRDLVVGTGIVALKITDHSASRSWYPPRVAVLTPAGSQVTTYELPVEHYPDDTVCEMEASAFYSYATRFSTAELVQCYKVISDNETTGVTAVDAPAAETLIAGKLTEIAELCDTLDALAGELTEHGDIGRYYARYLSTWHFTASQQVQLRELLRRLAVYGSVDRLATDSWRQYGNAKILLKEMRGYLDSLPVRI